mgnify:FL=1
MEGGCFFLSKEGFITFVLQLGGNILPSIGYQSEMLSIKDKKRRPLCLLRANDSIEDLEHLKEFKQGPRGSLLSSKD